MKVRLFSAAAADAKILAQHLDGLTGLSRKEERALDGTIEAIEKELGEYGARVDALDKEFRPELRAAQADGDGAEVNRLVVELEVALLELQDGIGQTRIRAVLTEDQHAFLLEHASHDKLSGQRFEGDRDRRRRRERVADAVVGAGYGALEDDKLVELSQEEAIPDLARAREKRERRATRQR